MALPGTDPGSVSHLGGVLRTTAATLAVQSAALSRGSAIDDLCAATVHGLDRVGAALQTHAQELAESAVALGQLEARARAAGLELQAWSVIEPFGPVPAQRAADRAEERPRLQAQADRLAAHLARSRAQLSRLLDDAHRALATASDVARAIR